MHSLLENALATALAKCSSSRFMAVMEQQHDLLPDKPTYRNYELGLRTLARHISMYTPSIIDGGKRILEIGPGVGCWLMLARELGNAVHGEDCHGKLAESYRPIIEALDLDVTYHGFDRYLGLPHPFEPGVYDVIHSRGSIGGVLQSYNPKDLGTGVRFFCELFSEILAPGGEVVILHNAGWVADECVGHFNEHHGGLKLVKNTPMEVRLIKP